jgi:acyl-CoA thioesterase FadM
VRYFEEVGWDDGGTGVLPILGTVAAKYLAAVEYPDRLTVETGPVSFRGRKLVLAHRITNRKKEVVTLGLSVVVAAGRKGQERPEGWEPKVPARAAAAIAIQLAGG